MYAPLFGPIRYTFLGMRENSYLIASPLMTGFLLVWVAHSIHLGLAAHSGRIGFVLEFGIIAVASGFVFVFLHPVSQFIHFQY